MDSRVGQVLGSWTRTSSPNDAPKPTAISLNDVIAGFRALIEKEENPHPKEISSNMHVLPNSTSRSPQEYDEEISPLSVLLSCWDKFLQPLTLKHFKAEFLRIINAKTAPVTYNFNKKIV